MKTDKTDAALTAEDCPSCNGLGNAIVEGDVVFCDGCQGTGRVRAVEEATGSYYVTSGNQTVDESDDAEALLRRTVAGWQWPDAGDLCIFKDTDPPVLVAVVKATPTGPRVVRFEEGGRRDAA